MQTNMQPFPLYLNILILSLDVEHVSGNHSFQYTFQCKQKHIQIL